MISYRKRRLISVLLINIFLAIAIYYLIFLWQNKNNIRISIPLTLKERVISFMEEEDILFAYAQNSEDILLFWKDLKIKIGDNEQLDRKATIIKYLFPVLQERYSTIEYLDVRFPENIVIKYRIQSI